MEPLWMDIVGLALAIGLLILAFWIMPYTLPSPSTSSTSPIKTHTSTTHPKAKPTPNQLAKDFDKGMVEGLVVWYLLNSK